MNEIHGLLLCDDLLFSSRIAGEAKAHGLPLRTTKSAQDLLNLSRQTPPRCVILDLYAPGLDIDAVVSDLKSLTPRPMVIGYGSHVDTATLKKARDAGCDVVWPRSKFMEELAEAMPGWFVVNEEAT